MAFVFPTSGLTNGQVFVTPSGIAYTYNSTTNAWAPGFTRSQLVNQSFTATAGQTVFTVLGGYSPGIVDIYRAGIKLPSSDFTATNGTTFTLINQCETGDDVQIRSFSQFTLANMVKKNSTSGDTMDNVVIGGNTPAAATFTSVSSGPLTNVTSINGGQLAGLKNKIINGDFNIDQRYEGSSIPNPTSYTMDRWAAHVTPNASVAQGGYVLQNFNNSFTALSNAVYTLAAGDYASISQTIEGVNITDFQWGGGTAQSASLSFWVYSTYAGTYYCCLRTYTSPYMSYVMPISCPTANTWYKFTATVPGPTSGTWNNTAGTGGIMLFITMAAGSTYQTSTLNSWVSGNYLVGPTTTPFYQNNNTRIYITGVQLERSPVVTAWESRPYSLELSLCQRYFEKSYSRGLAPGSTADSYNNVALFYLNGQTSQQYATFMQWYYKVTKMSSATLTLYSHASGTSGMARDMTNNADVTANAQMQGTAGGASSATLSKASGTIYMGQAWTASSEL